MLSDPAPAPQVRAKPAASSKPAPKSAAAAAPASGARRGRPAGQGPNHKGAILAAIKSAGKAGISSADLMTALLAAKHEIKSTTLSTLLSKMRGNNDLIAVGEARNYHYKLPPKS